MSQKLDEVNEGSVSSHAPNEDAGRCSSDYDCEEDVGASGEIDKHDANSIHDGESDNVCREKILLLESNQ